MSDKVPWCECMPKSLRRMLPSASTGQSSPLAPGQVVRAEFETDRFADAAQRQCAFYLAARLQALQWDRLRDEMDFRKMRGVEELGRFHPFLMTGAAHRHGSRIDACVDRGGAAEAVDRDRAVHAVESPVYADEPEHLDLEFHRRALAVEGELIRARHLRYCGLRRRERENQDREDAQRSFHALSFRDVGGRRGLTVVTREIFVARVAC